MKKIWKIRKNSEAVSPVIATILMVAITVVLAAVLYVMVMGFGGPTTQTPTGSFTMVDAINPTTEKVQFGVITPQIQWADIKIVVANGALGTETYTLVYAAGAVTGTVVAEVAGAAVTSVMGTDLAADGKVGNGDYLTIVITGTSTWTVTMIYIQTGDSIDNIEFTK